MGISKTFNNNLYFENMISSRNIILLGLIALAFGVMYAQSQEVQNLKECLDGHRCWEDTQDCCCGGGPNPICGCMPRVILAVTLTALTVLDVMLPISHAHQTEASAPTTTTMVSWFARAPPAHSPRLSPFLLRPPLLPPFSNFKYVI